MSTTIDEAQRNLKNFLRNASLKPMGCYFSTLREFDLEPFAENLETFPTAEELRARLDAETLQGLADFAALITGALAEDERPEARSLYRVFSMIQDRAACALAFRVS